MPDGSAGAGSPSPGTAYGVATPSVRARQVSVKLHCGSVSGSSVSVLWLYCLSHEAFRRNDGCYNQYAAAKYIVRLFCCCPYHGIINRKGKRMGNAVYYRSKQLEIIHLRNKHFIYSEHNHVSVYTIGLVLHGEITLKCNGKYTPCPSHGFFVVAPYQVHTLLLPDTYDMVSICVDKNLITTYKPYELSGVLSQMLPQLSTDMDYTFLVEALDAMCRCETPEPSDNAILSSALSLWSNPEGNNGLQAIADEACYSLYHYIRAFKQHIGITPHKFQIQNRVRKAQRMIESGETFTDVALELGFYDQSHFIKCFKSIIGLTPSEYRKAARRIG